MASVAVSYFLLVFLCNSFMESAQTTQVKNSWNVIEELGILSRAVAGLQEKIEEQATLLTSLQAQSSAQTTLLTHLNSNKELQTTSLSSVQAELSVQKDFLNNLESTAATQAILLNNLESKVDVQETLLTSFQAQSSVQTTLLNKIIANLEIQGTLINKVVAEQEWLQPVPQYQTNRTIVALEGDDVEIRCVVRGIPLPEITWTKENGTLASDRVVIANNGKALWIKNVKTSDRDTYICVAANGVGRPVSQSVGLEVYPAAQQCHRMIELDMGNLEITTLSIGCVVLIKLVNKTGFRLGLDPRTTEPILIIPEQNPSNSNSPFFRINGSHSVIHEFAGNSLAIVVPPGRVRTTLNWRGLAVDDSSVTSSTEFKNNPEGTLEWEPTREGTHKIFWAVELGVTEHLRWTLITTDLASDPHHPCESISLAILEISLDGNVSEIEKTCEGSSIGVLMSEKGSQVLILLQIKSAKETKSNFKVTWRHHGVPLKKNVEGILAGTEGKGAFVIPFNSTQTRLMPPGSVYGVAFDWNSRRIYKYQWRVGIVRSNLDGSQSNTMLSDLSSSEGISIEPISGNIYYGDRESTTIRVCSNDATNCSLIANRSDLSSVQDIAVHSSKGLLFWSIEYKKVVRANLDGSNATVILEGLEILGIDVDELEDRLYFGSREGIRSCDLNGRDIQTLPNLSTSVRDVAIDGDKVYYSHGSTNSIHVISKSGTNSALVTELPNYAHHIAVYGTGVSNQPPNPCKKSRCAHLCVVMSPSSYQCMCPGTKALNKDGRTCQP